MTAPDPIFFMQQAVDIVNTSPHATNKIAATLFNADGTKSLSHTNFWPPAIAKKFGPDERIGNSSGTIHAETACILASSFATEGAGLCVTDPFCPNCAKNVAEAGIKTLYIDHKGFGKDFATRRSGDFNDMSMKICEHAGISVYEVRRKEGRVIPLFEALPGFIPRDDRPVACEPFHDMTESTFIAYAADATIRMRDVRFAIALARDTGGKLHRLVARAHLAVGYSAEADLAEIENIRGQKYSLAMEPINRILMNAARRGLMLLDGFIYSSAVPTAREQVNLAGENIRTLWLGSGTQARDDGALQALAVMKERGIIDFRTL